MEPSFGTHSLDNAHVGLRAHSTVNGEHLPRRGSVELYLELITRGIATACANAKEARRAV